MEAVERGEVEDLEALEVVDLAARIWGRQIRLAALRSDNKRSLSWRVRQSPGAVSAPSRLASQGEAEVAADGAQVVQHILRPVEWSDPTLCGLGLTRREGLEGEGSCEVVGDGEGADVGDGEADSPGEAMSVLARLGTGGRASRPARRPQAVERGRLSRVEPGDKEAERGLLDERSGARRA